MKVVDAKVVKKIIKDYAMGKTPTELSNTYEVSRSSIYRWIRVEIAKRSQMKIKMTPRELYNSEVELNRLRLDSQVFYDCKCGRNSPIIEKLVEIKRLYKKYNIHALCRILDVNSSTFYHYLKRKPEKTQIQIGDEIFASRIKDIFSLSNERFGARKIKVKLKEEGHIVSLERIRRLMQEMDLECKQSRLRVYSTTSRKYKYYKNKLQQNFITEAPNLAWVSDITYIRVNDDFQYICIVMDLFSRRVLAYNISNSIDMNLVKNTFDKAFYFRNRPSGLLFHSDQGSQYTAFDFRKYLRDLSVKQSFSNAGTPLDNAVAESFFACMKREELSHNYYNTKEQLDKDVSDYINYYNGMRPHQRIGNKTPEQIENEFKIL